VQLNVEQRNGKMRFRFEINDSRLGFRVVAAATSPMGINNRAVSDPVGLPFRTFNGFNVNNAFRAASQSDVLIVPTKDANLTFRAPGKRLRFPAGRLTIVGIGPSITFSRNVEFVVKFE
jgi:hypothetical protein